MIEIRIALQPKQRLFAQAIDKYPVTFYGGAKGGGKSKGLQLIMLLRRLQYPGSTGAIFRKTYPELEGNHIRPLLTAFPQLRPYYSESKKLLALPNGSTLQFCHCEGEKDVSLYQGREFHDLAIDEAGQWEEAVFRTLQGSNRSSIPGIKSRTILTGNPGGTGHKWLKRLFVERRFNPLERPEDYHFIRALVHDNDALIKNDPDYLRKLQAEPNEALRKAYLDGDWDIFAGQFFGEIRREVHVIKPRDIPGHWSRFGAYDYGFNHPAAFGWFASDTDGNVYLYREYVKAQQRVDQFAAHVNSFKDTELIGHVHAGLDCWTKRDIINDKTPPTIAEQFQKEGIFLKKAIVDRVQGASQVRKYLAWQNFPQGRDKPPINGKPRFYIFETCPVTFECLTRMQHDPDHVEDVLKVDASDGDPMGGDDPYDMVRYGLMSRPYIPDVPKVVHPWGSPEWAKEEVVRMEKDTEEWVRREREAGTALDDYTL